MDFFPIENLFKDEILNYFFLTSNLIAFVSWIATLLFDNYSQVDRLWSILPPIYAWSFLFTAIYYSPSTITSEINTPILKSDLSSLLRLIVITVLVTLWGARLTYNFWRKGGYNHKEEDYRWIYVRKMFDYPRKKFLFHMLNFWFTAFFQNWLLLGLVVPMWFIQTNRQINEPRFQKPFNIFDLILTLLYILFFFIEIKADQQQFNFQTKKRKWLDEKISGIKSSEIEYTQEELEDFELGFLTRGLFKYSRHPNFFAEISMWWVIYGFSLSSQHSFLTLSFHYSNLLNYSIFGTASLTILFQMSTILTEYISASKYPKYKEYKKMVSRIIPWFPSSRKIKQ